MTEATDLKVELNRMRTEVDVNVMCRYNTTSPTPYDQIRPTLLNPAKEATSVSDSESIPSPCTSPPQARRHYGESITSLGKASIMGEHRDTWRGYGCMDGRYIRT